MRRRPSTGTGFTALLAGAAVLATLGCQRKPVNDAWFADIAQSTGITFRHDNGADGNHRYIEVLPGGVAVLDIDSDGLQDLIFVQSGPSTRDRSKFRESTLRVYRNRGLLKFEDISASCGLVGDFGYAHGIAVADIDSDQRPDVFVTSLQGNRLFRNIDGKRYEDVTEAWGLAEPAGYGTSAVFGDVDGDRRPDLFVCRYAQWDYDNPVAVQHRGTPRLLPPRPLRAVNQPAVPQHRESL